MSPIPISSDDILYICVSTYQNTINLFPIEHLKGKLINAGKLYTFILSTPTANRNNWTDRLSKLLPNSYIGSVNENNSYSQNILDVEMEINKSFNIKESSNIYINYGGGLKHFTPVLWAMIAKYNNAKVTMVYPDKTTEKILFEEHTNGKPSGYSVVDTLLNFDSDQVISLFTDSKIKKTTLMYQFLPDTRFNQKVLLSLPNLYEDNELKDLLFELTTDMTNSDFDSLSANDFFEKLNPESKKKDKILINLAKDNIKNMYNDFDYPFKIDSDFKCNIRAKINLENKDIREVANQFKKVFFSRNNYKPRSRNLAIHSNLKNALKKYNLTLPQNCSDNAIQINNTTIQEIFAGFEITYQEDKKETTSIKIENHGRYFELLILKLIYEWAKNNSNYIKEVHFSAKEETAKLDQIEFDMMVYTCKGNIYFFECKTFNFRNKDFLASYFKAKEFGGVFNNYIIVVPPLPVDTKLNSHYDITFEAVNNVAKRQKEVVFCQLTSAHSSATKYMDLNIQLQKILDKEKKS